MEDYFISSEPQEREMEKRKLVPSSPLCPISLPFPLSDIKVKSSCRVSFSLPFLFSLCEKFVRKEKVRQVRTSKLRQFTPLPIIDELAHTSSLFQLLANFTTEFLTFLSNVPKNLYFFVNPERESEKVNFQVSVDQVDPHLFTFSTFSQLHD